MGDINKFLEGLGEEWEATKGAINGGAIGGIVGSNLGAGMGRLKHTIQEHPKTSAAITGIVAAGAAAKLAHDYVMNKQKSKTQMIQGSQHQGSQSARQN